MTESPELSGRPQCCRGIRAWLLLWTILLAAEAVLLTGHAALDTLGWRTTRWLMGDQDAYSWVNTKDAHAAEDAAPFYYRVDPPMQGHLYKNTEKFWRVLRDFGEPEATALLFIVVCLYDQRRRWRAGVILIASAMAAGLTGALIRMIGGRFRPNAQLSPQFFNEGGNYWQLFRGFHESRDLSFPSGHATLAFAAAAALTYLSPRGKWLFITIAAGTALSRVVMQAHFYSDVLFGSVFGWTLGWFVAVAVDRTFAPHRATA